jgi:hypothetical protein
MEGKNDLTVGAMQNLVSENWWWREILKVKPLCWRNGNGSY